MRRILLFACSLFFCMWALAVPAKRVKRTLTLADGTQKEVVLQGDEYVHYYADADGNVYTESADGCFVRADKQVLETRWSKRLSAQNKRRLERAERRGMNSHIVTGRMQAPFKSNWGAESNPISGSKKGLVILVNFSDLAMKASHSQSFYDGFFNGIGFSGEGMYGSVHDYFSESSYGQFDLTFDVVGPVTVSKNYAHYGANDSNGDDKYAASMVIEACKLAEQKGVDFRKYDWDGDGQVDQVFVVYAGYGENQGAPSNTIWPHEYALSEAAKMGDGSGALLLDGVVVDTYAVSCELLGTSGSKVDGIGTACHEFSHCLCLPDMYDTAGSRFGMDAWDLMDCGSYSGPNNSGTCPTSFTSYERMYCGWLKPKELTQGCMVENMGALALEQEAYIIYNDNYRNEYYLLENRQQVGFDSYLPGHGLLILHVDFDTQKWMDNTVNNSSRQLMTIIPADNKLGTSSVQLAGDPWPGTSENTSLTDTSVPSAALYHVNANGSKLMGKPIDHIAEDVNDGTIKFRFKGGAQLSVPTGIEVASVTAGGTAFTLRWNPVDGASEYEVQLTERDDHNPSPEEHVLIQENFSKFVESSVYSTNYELDTVLDKFMEVAGWKGRKLFYTPEHKIRLGSNNASGSLTTPMLSSSTGMVTVLIYAQKYKSDTGFLNVMINDELIGSLTPQEEEEGYLYKTSVEGGFKLTLSTISKRAYVCRVVVVDGEFDEEQMKSMSRRKVNKSVCCIVNDTVCSFANLNPEMVYSVQVRSISDLSQSEWSESLEVDLADRIDGVVESQDVGVRDVRICDMFGREIPTLPKQGLYIRSGKKILRR